MFTQKQKDRKRKQKGITEEKLATFSSTSPLQL